MSWPKAFATVATTVAISSLVAATPVGQAWLSPYAIAASVPVATKQGINYYNKGQIAKALPLFEKGTQQSPDSMDAHLWLARAYKKQGGDSNVEKSKYAFYRVHQLNPSNVEALSNLGEMLSWDPSSRSEAIAFLSQAVQLDNSKTENAKLLSQLLYWENRLDEALVYAAPISEIYADDVPWTIDYAKILSGTGHADKAIDIFENRLLADQSDDLALRLAYDMALFRDGQKSRAEMHFDQLKPSFLALAGPAQTDDRAADLMNQASGLAFELQRFWDVIEIDQALPAQWQGRKNVQLRVARAYLYSQRVPEGMDVFQRLYSSGQLNADEKIEYADYIQTLRLSPDMLAEPDLVASLYRSALNDDPSHPVAAMRLAGVAAKQGDFDEAVNYYQQAYANSQRRSGDINPYDVKEEFLTFLKNDKSNPAKVRDLFQQMLSAGPNDYQVKGAYAGYLSYDKATQIEALEMFLELSTQDAAHQDKWRASLEEVLGWHTPSTDHIDLYQRIVNRFPNSKSLALAVARAYRNDPAYFTEAVDVYNRLMAQYPSDLQIQKEWTGLLMMYEHRRDEAMAILRDTISVNPNHLEARTAYGKLLSYERQYNKALEQFDYVLAEDPAHSEAIVAKGYTLIWSGHKLIAKRHFIDAFQQYPEDVYIGLGLAQANKMLGRYDEAFRVMEDVRRLLRDQNVPIERYMDVTEFMSSLPQESLQNNGIILAENTHTYDPLMDDAEFDFSIMPYSETPVTPAVTVSESKTSVKQKQDAPTSQQAYQSVHQAVVQPVVQPVRQPVQRVVKTQQPQQPVPSAYTATYSVQPRRSGRPQLRELAKPTYSTSPSFLPEPQVASVIVPEPKVVNPKIEQLQSDLDSLNFAIDSLKAIQNTSSKQLERLSSTVDATGDAIVTETALHHESPNMDHGDHLVLGEPEQAYALFSSLPYDTNPLLSGLGRLRNDDLYRMENGLVNELRPMLRAGYFFSTQEGEDTTSKFRYWGFPNELSVSITPTFRGRFSLDPYRYSIPSGQARDPNSTWSQAYSGGATWRMTDRLTFNGDMAITHFNQSDSNNITYRAGLDYKFNDHVSAAVGGFREPQRNSLLAVAGQRPNQGAFSNDLVGQVRETGVFAQLNTNWLNSRVDANLAYEYARVSGSEVPSTNKNFAYGGLGYTHYYAKHHKARLGYELVYFGYGKNATVGFFDTTNTGVRTPVAGLNPVVASNPAYDFGGYFSPIFFMQNDFRLDFRGYFWDKLIEYKLGGMLGVQNFKNGHGIPDGDSTSMTTGFDANVIMNFTDWFATYANVDFLDAGGAFNRWQFGAGIILRPHLPALSPIFGGPREIGEVAEIQPEPEPQPVLSLPPVDPYRSLEPLPAILPGNPAPEPEEKYVPGYY